MFAFDLLVLRRITDHLPACALAAVSVTSHQMLTTVEGAVKSRLDCWPTLTFPALLSQQIFKLVVIEYLHSGVEHTSQKEELGKWPPWARWALVVGNDLELTHPKYKLLQEHVSVFSARCIEKDVPRTCPSAVVDHNMLSRVLKGLAAMSETGGYRSGMNFIAGAILKRVGDEYLAFLILANFFNHTSMFTQLAVDQRLQIFETEMAEHCREIAMGLDARLLQPAMYAAGPISLAFVPMSYKRWSQDLDILLDHILTCQSSGELDQLVAETAIARVRWAADRLHRLWQAVQADEFEETLKILQQAFSASHLQILPNHQPVMDSAASCEFM